MTNIYMKILAFLIHYVGTSYLKRADFLNFLHEINILKIKYLCCEKKWNPKPEFESSTEIADSNS